MQERLIAGLLVLWLAFLIIIPAVSAEDASDWYVKGKNAANLGNFGNAVQYFNNAITLDNNYAAAYGGKALALNQLGRYDEAIAAAEKAIAIKNEPDASYARAFALYSLGRDAEAVDAFEAFFALQVVNPDAYCTQGKAYTRLNQTDKAIASFNRCAKLAPQTLEGWYQKGLALLSAGRYQEALDAFDRCTQITVTDAKVWNSKGLAYAGVGDYTKALDSFKMAVNLDPSFEEAKVNRDKAFERKPFFTHGVTQTPKGAVTQITTPQQPATATPSFTVRTTVPTPLLPAAPPDQTTTAARTTYAALSPFAAVIGLVAGAGILIMQTNMNR